MNCPHCGKDNTRVYGGKETAFGSYERYRKCLSCGIKFKTIEIYRAKGEINESFYDSFTAKQAMERRVKND